MKLKALTILALALCAYLPAYAEKKRSPKSKKQTELVKDIETTPRVEPQTEFEQLTVILTKYSSNHEAIPALHYAALQGDVNAVNLLLKYGADPFGKDRQSNWKNTLPYAIESGSLPIVKTLLYLGLDIYNCSEVGQYGFGSVWRIASSEIIKFLILEANITTEDLNNLQHAILWREDFTNEQKIDVIQITLDCGASIGRYIPDSFRKELVVKQNS